MQNRTVLERFANLYNKYDSTVENKRAITTKSVLAVAEGFLNTPMGSVLGRPNYGMPSLFEIVNTFNDPTSASSLFAHIKNSLEGLDKRIERVEVKQGLYAGKETGIPYIDIEVYLKRELFPNLTVTEVVMLSLGYDMLGNIYQVKEK